MESTNRPAIIFLLTSSYARLDIYRSIHLAYQATLNLVMINPIFDPDFSLFFHHWLLSDCYDDPSHLATLLRGFKVIAVVSFDEFGIYPAAKLGEYLGVKPYPMGPEGLVKIMDKRRFRGWCVAHGIPSPRFL